MPAFGKVSRKKLDECHWDLQRLMERVVEIRDISVVCGKRNKEDQNQAFAAGKSHLKWPNSNHNVIDPASLSNAVDIVPWPEQYTNELVMVHVAGIVLGVAAEMGIKIIWGGSWPGLRDNWHFEIEN
tara:strand:+ start:737 stop:1117 length:381 start_codon:yes stop_codon:yes gene_type:complete